MNNSLRPAKPDELHFLRSLANYQFRANIGDKFLPNNANVRVKISRNTGRIREVWLNDKRVASLRASSYTYILTIEGGKILHKLIPFPSLRVVVVNEISDDILANPTNVFARHVIMIDENLRPGDEVLVVNEDDKLLCVGRLHLSPYEVLHFIRGVAVKVKECVKV